MPALFKPGGKIPHRDIRTAVVGESVFVYADFHVTLRIVASWLSAACEKTITKSYPSQPKTKKTVVNDISVMRMV